MQPLRGPGYVKRLNNDAPVTYDLTWRMTRDQAAQFQTWFYSMSASGLAMGRNQFQLEIDTEFGKLLHGFLAEQHLGPLPGIGAMPRGAPVELVK